MKRFLAFSIATLLGATCVAQNFYPYSKEFPLELGKGFNITDPSEAKLPFLDNIQTNYENEQGATSYLDYRFVTSTESFNKLFSSDAALNARFLFRKLSTSFEISNESTTAGEYKTLVFIAKTEFGKKSIADFKLKQEAQKLIDEKRYDEFIERYGTSFVQKVSTGISLYVFLTLRNEQFLSMEEKDFSIDAGGRILGGSMDINKLISTSKQNNDITVKIVANGPSNSFSDLAAIIEAATNAPNPLSEITTAIANYMKTFKRENSLVTGYHFSPVSLFGIPKDKIQWSQLRDNDLVQIKSNYEEISEDIQSIKDFKQSCLFKNGKEENKQKLSGIQTQWETLRDSLVKQHQKCLDLTCKVNCCNNIEPSDVVVKEAENVIRSFLVIKDTKLQTSELQQGYTKSWTVNSQCIEDNSLIVDFNADIAPNVLWNLFDIYLDIDFLINDKIIYSYKGSKTGGHKIAFTNKVFRNDASLTEAKFKVQVNKIKLTGLDGKVTTANLPLENGLLKVSLLSDF